MLFYMVTSQRKFIWSNHLCLFLRGSLSGKVCKLKNGIYGLTQSPQTWFGKFNEVVLDFGLQQCQVDHSVFNKNSESSKIILVVYVDDIVITGSDSESIIALKVFLQRKFHTKGLDKLRYFFEIEVTTSRSGIGLSEHKYVLDNLHVQNQLILPMKPVQNWPHNTGAI